MKQKIIFLDVDGPLIPTGCYLVNALASVDYAMSNIAVACVKTLVEEFDALIVMNTVHNSMKNRLWNGLMKNGFEKKHFHKNWQTTFMNDEKLSMNDSSFFVPLNTNRLVGINEWIDENGIIDDFDWIAFDDENYTDDERLILIDFDYGITMKEYNKAVDFWNGKRKIIL